MGTVPDIRLDVSLPDGTPISIRPVVAEDKPLFAEGFRKLSDSSRFLRFLRPMQSLPARDLTFFTEIDYVDHMAWGAIFDCEDVDQGVGVARYVRFSEDPHVAEVAITVIDPFHRRRVATHLLGALYWSAIRNGISSFLGHVLADNSRMIRFLEELQAEITEEDSDLMRVEISIVRELDDYPVNRTTDFIKRVVRSLDALSQFPT